MRNNKELVRAHNAVVRRLVTAAVTGQPDAWEQPLRRSSTATVVGLAVAVVLTLGFLVYGLIRPGGGPSLRADTTVVVEKETGTRFVVDKGVLRPVPNLASALLAVGPQPQLQTLSRARTSLLPRAAPVGIPGAPDTVPPAGALVRSVWSACVRATPSDGGATPGLRLVFGVPEGVQLPRPVGDDEGVLAVGPDGQQYLVVAGVRYALGSDEVRTVLGYAAVPPVTVPPEWLAAFRPGRPLTLLAPKGLGEAGPDVAGGRTRVGEVLAVREGSGRTQYFLVARDVILPLTALEQRLLLGNPDVAQVNGGSAPRLVDVSAPGAATQRPLPQARGWPRAVPRPVGGRDLDVCLSGTADGALRLGTRPADGADGGSGPARVRMPWGTGVLAAATDAAGRSTGGAFFLDDVGRRYALPHPESVEALGWAGVRPLPVPAVLLEAVPSGPELTVAAARGVSAPAG